MRAVTSASPRSSALGRSLAILLVALAGPARADTSPTAGATSTWVIPPGQEAVVTEMLGGAEGFAGCRYDTVGLARDRVQATFECAGGAPLRLELARHDGAACPSLCTSTFAIRVLGGAPPEGFLPALQARITEAEPRFRWSVARTLADGRPSQLHRIVMAAVLLGLVGLVVVRRRQLRRNPPPP